MTEAQKVSPKNTSKDPATTTTPAAAMVAGDQLHNCLDAADLPLKVLEDWQEAAAGRDL